MNAITVKNLETLIGHLNRMTNSPETSYTRSKDGPLQANIGNFHLDSSNGTYGLQRMMNEGGGVDAIFYGLNKRELFQLIHAYIKGFELAKANR